MQVYRRFQSWIVEPWFLPRWMSPTRIAEERTEGLKQAVLPARTAGRARAWFHAASVGELESLTPVVETWVQEGSEAIVTVFSESARGSVNKLQGEIGQGTGNILYVGYSPWEGSWGAALKRVQVDVFVTAKYEAWPELWASLAEQEVPLLIVSAKARRSLRLVGSLCHLLGARVPNLTLLTVRNEDSAELKELFEGVKGTNVLRTGEPRWDRVNFRAKRGNARARELVARCKDLPRPWGVLAQVWTEDMEVWRGQLGSSKGTLWVVPHRVDPKHVSQVEGYLRQAGMSVQKTSSVGVEPIQAECVLVDEMGVLLELYSAVDWAYVGGGFGTSMHSTIEPALQGLPITCGPHGEHDFPEIDELIATEQLTVVRDRMELAAWLEALEKLPGADSEKRRSRWKSQASERLGATQNVLDAIQKACS